MIKLMRSVLFSLLVFLAALSKSQSSIGLDVEINQDLVQQDDPGGQLINKNALSVSYGLAYRYQFKNNFGFSTGLRLKDYPYGQQIIGVTLHKSDGNMALQLPLHFHRDFKVYEKFDICPVVGAGLNYFLFEVPTYSSFEPVRSFVPFKDSVHNSQQVFVTINFGVEFEIKLHKRVSLFVFHRYNRGLRTVSTNYITYLTTQGNKINARQLHSGTHYSLFGLKMVWNFGE